MTVSRNEDDLPTWESDSYPYGTVAVDEDDTDPADRDDFADEGADEVYVHHYEEDGKP